MKTNLLNNKFISKLLSSIKNFYFKHKKLSIIILSILGLNYLFLFTLKIIPYKELDELRNKPYSSRIYDRNGYLLQVTSLKDGLRREWIPYNKIPQEVINIFLESEDKRFFLHHGIDYLAILNAFKQNSESGKTVRGASTITMQLSKIISPNNEKTFSRKLKDAINAFRIEAKLSKKEILELYLNSVPFGMNSEGITSAARSFFGKEIESLTPEEICCLSVIPRSPSVYNPINNPQNNAGKAILIYKKLYKSDETDETLYSKILNTANSAFKYQYPFYMPHLINYLQSVWKSNNSIPYEIQLSADINIQYCAENFIHEALEQSQQSRISNAALLVINNKDNSVIAWVGSGNFFDDKNNGQIDGVTTLNQAGSSMKPFLYATAMEIKDLDGKPIVYPSKVLADIPREFGDENIYIPANFNNRYNGPIRVRTALASSLNVPAVTVLSEIGNSTYLKKLFDLGFTSLESTGQNADLGLALGAGEVSLLELVNAFSVFAHDGILLPISFSKNTDKAIAKIEKTGKKVFEPDTARIICSILSDKQSRSLGFGYTQSFQTEYPSIFKTGTANQYQDIVALGGTTDYTIGVWMGNFSGETVIGKTGSSLPAWVARNVLDLLVEQNNNMGNETRDFNKPENYVKQKICSLSGKIATDYCPATITEYIPKDLVPEFCDWHRFKNNKILTYYPPEYQQWFRLYGEKGILDYHATNLKFLTPNDNTLFYKTERFEDRQAICFEIIGGQKDILYVEYDGNEYTTLSRPFSFYLPLDIGKHTITVKCGLEQASLNFEVK